MSPPCGGLLIAVSLLGLVLSFTSDELRVTLSNGSKLIGRYLRSFSGRPIKAFTNIPYAKPPIGSLRFKDPEPMEKWYGEYEAIEDGPMCPQYNLFNSVHVDEGVEDCLRLNVYVPHSYDRQLTNLSVMVYIYGSAYVMLSGMRPEYSPDYFLDENIILVSGNYRLGAFGFLSTEDENCSGNFALKDVVMILKWVQENIERFGGNPNSVTIFGPSTGSVFVTYLMASPLAEGLFHRAIAQSGHNMAIWTQPHPKGLARKRAKQLAKYLNCYTPNNWPKTMDCLRDVPAREFTAILSKFYVFDRFPKVAFLPVVEPESPRAVITEHPSDVIAERSLKIPFMTGNTYDEGLIKSLSYITKPRLFDKLAANLFYALPIIFEYDHYNQSTQELITARIMEFYFQNELTRDKEQNLTNLFSDEWYLATNYLHMRLSKKDVAPTFVYLYSYRGAYSNSEWFGGHSETFYGVCHADYGIHLFDKRAELAPKTLPTKDEEQIRAAMVEMWVNFARTGKPVSESSKLPKWDPAVELPVDFYRLGNLHFEDKPLFGMESGGLFEDRAKFWREIYAILRTDVPTIDFSDSEEEEEGSTSFEFEIYLVFSALICAIVIALFFRKNLVTLNFQPTRSGDEN